MARRSLCSALSLCATLGLTAQTPPPSAPPCGFDQFHQQLKLSFPDYASRTSSYEAHVRHFDMSSRDAGTLFVPVVVHVMETGNSLTQITDDQVRDAIKAVNERYRKVAGTAGAGTGVDTHIEFALAVRDPNGNCTTGITRVNMTGNATYMASGVFRSTIGITDAQLKAYDTWDPTKYYNIWVVSEIDGNDGGNGVAGFAAFPSAHGTTLDGCIAICNYVKNPASTVLSHELGHAMGLYHTFEGDNNGASCPANANCATDGDQVCDTPPHIRSNSDCNSGGTNACDGGSSNLLFVKNYMDYSSAACQNMFTAGQNTRIQTALTVDRASYLAANGNLSLVPPSAPIMQIIASKTILCGIGQSVQLFDKSYCIPNTYLMDPDLPGLTFAWTITNGTETQNSNMQNPVFTLNSTGVFNATLQITTSLGTYTRTENGIVIVAAAPGAACTPTSLNPSGNYGLTVYNVAFNTLNSATDAITSFPYTDYTCSRNTVVSRGSTYQLSVSITSGSANAELFVAFIDFNNNNTFEAGEQVATGTITNGSTTVNTNVTIPITAITGSLLRLRVYGEVGSWADAKRTCSAQMLVADVEDYGVYVTTNLAGVSIAASPSTTITYGTNVTFTPTPVNGGASPSYIWYRNGSSVGTNSTYASNNLLPGETIQCEMFSSLAGVIASPAVSNTLTMTVTGPPQSNFTSSIQKICTGGTVSFTDASLLSPTSWSWSFPGGSPSTSTTQNPTVTYPTAGTYNVTLIASNANGTGTTMTKTGHITVYTSPNAGCTVTRSTTPAGNIGITNVTLNTINNSTAYDDAVMNNFVCSQITSLQTNTAYNISVGVSPFNSQWVRAYIDYNNNGNFTDSGEQIFAPANGTSARTGSFTTPAAPQFPNTLLRMRVITDFVNTSPGSCTTPLQYGQVEEYGVVLIPLPNTAPTLNAAATPVLSPVNEDNGSPVGAVGTLVSSLVDLASVAGGLDNVTDADGGAVAGIAITAADVANGSWFYTTNAGGAWNALGSPTNSACRLLAADANTRLYFQPALNYNGTVANAITFRAWDQTTGSNGGTGDATTNGGSSAFSTATDVAAITVTPVNDAPTGTNLSANETFIEDTPLNLIDIVVADVDNTTLSVTLTLSNPAAGSLSTGTSGAVTSTYTAGTGVWSANGAIADLNALLAAVSFTPALNFSSSFTIATSVSDGTASAPGSKTMTATAVNDAPTATNLSAPETYSEDVALNLVDIVTSDVDNASLTVILTLSNPAAGSLNTGTSGAVTSTYTAGTGVWTASGAIANVNTLLAGLIFTPALNFNSNFTIATSVSDGVAAAVTGSKAMTGTPVNDAPLLNASASPVLATNLEDAPAPVGAVGTLISSLVDFAVPAGQLDNVTDVDASASTGVAIIAADIANGTWFYSINAGASWNPLGSPTGSVSRLLAADASSRIYFQPTANFNGTLANAITFRAWDQTSGSNGTTADASVNGGTTAFSASTDVAALTVTASNDAPSASNLNAAEIYTEDTPLNLVDIVISDVDNTSLTVTMTLSNTAAGSLSTGTSGAVTSTYVAGTGVWTASGAITDVNVLLAGVSFNPASNFNGSFTIATSVSDGSASATGSKSFTGVPVNDAPVLNVTPAPALAGIAQDPPLPAGAVGTLVSALIDFAAPSGQLDNVTDVDAGAVTGIAVIGADATNGTWYYSTSNGASWSPIGSPTGTAATLLAADASTRLYFRSNAGFFGTVTNAVTFRAWDQTSGVNGGTANASVNGGTTAFSASTDVASITVNPTSVQVAPIVILEGPYNSTTGLMNDGLRVAAMVPTTEPYTGLGYVFTSGGGGGTVAPAVLATTGNNAIVDWVIVELRDNTTPSTIVASKNALLQRDGDVVATDGASALTIPAAPGTYRVAVRHRNHLGAMTLNGVPLSGNPTTVDLSSVATATFGTAATKSFAGTFPKQALWAGDVTFDHQVLYTGANNDRDPILVTVGSTTPNNVVSNTYSTRDVNMDANVQYTGAGNDRDPILVNVGSTTPNNVRVEQVP